MTDTTSSLLPALTPSQQAAFDGASAGIQKGRFVNVNAREGLGVSTVLRRLHAQLGGTFLSARDLFAAHATRGGDPLGLEESLAALLEGALAKTELLFIDDLDLLLRVISSPDGCGGSYPRSGYTELFSESLVQQLSTNGKRIIFGRGAHLSGIYPRTYSWTIEPFGANDYATICTNILGAGPAAKLDFPKIFRSSRHLDGHKLRSICHWLGKEALAGTLDTARFIQYLEGQQLISNVDLAQVTHVRFEELRGIDDLLQQLEMHLITPLENDALAAELAVRPKRGILLAGPPGTGKTSIGRALAHRLKSRFFLIDGTFISDSGQFYAAVDRVFEVATQNAPSVIFIDDTDVIFENGGATGLYRYLLTKLDGLESEHNALVCVMMTAMNVSSLPPALIRSGRIELWLETRLPNEAARASMLRDLLSKGPPIFQSLHVNRLAAATEGLTGADIKRLFDDGKLLYAYDRAKNLKPREMTNYFLDAVESVRNNKQRYAEAEQTALRRRPIRPPYYDHNDSGGEDTSVLRHLLVRDDERTIIPPWPNPRRSHSPRPSNTPKASARRAPPNSPSSTSEPAAICSSTCRAIISTTPTKPPSGKCRSAPWPPSAAPSCRRACSRASRAALKPCSKIPPAATADRCVLTWFNPWGLEKKILPGMQLRVTGKVTQFQNRLQMVNPKHETLDGKDEDALTPKSAKIEPQYPATADLPTNMIGKILAGMLDELLPQITEWFAAEHLKERDFFPRQEALRLLHQPRTLKDSITAKRSLAYHEFFLHQAAVAIKRFHQRNSAPAIPLRVDDAVDQRIRALLPFTLTAAQNRVIESIRKDLAAVKPMNRLLQGDVGSGKTVVALYAMLAATATRRSDNLEFSVQNLEFAGHQAALMAPTEILAEQHYITLQKLLEGKKVKIALLTSSVTGKERAAVLAKIADGSVGLVVGTHALLSEAVQFKSLALIIIDEQHKFGVEQRSLIRTKPSATGIAPHTLVMTATPIPRTLAMTAFGDLDVSVIDELPPGRQPIFTRMTPATNREEVYKWIAKKLKEKEQVYVVVPAIDESEQDLRSVTGVQEELQKEWLKDFRVALIHGRMTRETRQHIMERFRQGLIDVLVATTVIEVGVDVPNATIMVVEHADRFGLSQLHQLRGRVGRGSHQSYCILLGDLTGDDGIKRLEAMVKHTSGFKIAEEDLRLRGMGQMIGTAQSGRTDIHFADLLFDPHLLPMSRRDAFNIIAADPRLLLKEHTELRTAILHRFADSITLADVG